ncbi:polymer-forming cytoskeletal protein [Candidatus Omnitrophota bacterium]
MRLKREKKQAEDKILEVDASMQGTLVFKDPVKLRINGSFEGNLSTKGNLMIGEHARVRADVLGESIVIAGNVNGNITATKELKLIAPACVVGDVSTPVLGVEEGSILEGRCNMQSIGGKSNLSSGQRLMTVDELANYLEVDKSVISEWVNSGKLPAVKEGGTLKFDRFKVDEWVTAEKIK